MAIAPFPSTAEWRHDDPRSGTERTVFRARGGGWDIEGASRGRLDGQPWEVRYRVRVDTERVTRQAYVVARGPDGERSVLLEAGAPGRWFIDDRRAPHLDGCLDVDLESSAMTNALPVHRLGLGVADRAEAPAVYVRTVDLAVGVLDQTYVRLADRGGRPRYRYTAPTFDFTCELVYDESGLVVDYPGVAVRTA